MQSISNNSEARSQAGLLSSHSLLRNLWSVGVDLLFPPRCSNCGKVDSYWCDSCEAELNALPIAIYPKEVENLQAVASTSLHTGILQSAIHGLKYENAQQVAAPLGERMAQTLQQLNWQIDTLIPVPLHLKRLRERGYNQSKLLAEHIGAYLNIACVPEALQRQRETRSQVEVGTREQRLINVVDAFYANPQLVENRTILLVDDVCTTGATLSACAQAALSAGARGVYALTVTTAS